MTIGSAKTLPKRLNSIQALRGIAALLVLFFHLAEFQRQMAESNPADVALTQGFWDRGWAGVDLFFVISGFIMVYVTQKYGRNIRDVIDFLGARISRIYPLWWVCAGIMGAYFFISYGMPAAPDRVSSAEDAFQFALKSFLLIPQDVPPILGLGWTLIHELFFYLVFAMLLFVPRRNLIFMLCIWALFTTLGNIFIPMGNLSYLTQGLIFSPLTLEFILGAVVAIIVLKDIVYAPKALFISAAIMILMGLVFFPDIPVTSKSWLRVSVFALPFAALIYGWVSLERQGKLLPPKWLCSLGDWSYSLYLTHYIVLVTLRRIYRMLAPESLSVGALGFLDNLLFAVLAIGLSVMTSAIFYHIIERPSVTYLTRMRKERLA